MSSCRPGCSDFSPLVLSLEFQQLLDDLIGINLEFVVEMVLYFGVQLALRAVNAKIALPYYKGTWYFLIEDSLSFDRSNSYSTFFDIAKVILQIGFTAISQPLNHSTFSHSNIQSPKHSNSQPTIVSAKT